MFEQTFRNIDDVLWKEAGCTTVLDYVEQTSSPMDAMRKLGSVKDIHQAFRGFQEDLYRRE